MGRGTCLWVSSQVVRGSPGSVKPCTEIVCAQHFFFSGGKCNHLFLQSVSDLKKKIRNRGVDRLAIRKQTLHPRQPGSWGDARGSCAPQMTAGGGGGPPQPRRPRGHARAAGAPRALLLHVDREGVTLGSAFSAAEGPLWELMAPGVGFPWAWLLSSTGGVSCASGLWTRSPREWRFPFFLLLS